MKTALFAALAAVTFAPAAMAQTAAAPAPAPAAATAKFNLETPIQDIVADAKAKAALEANLPGISAHESYEMFKGMSLKQLAGYAADKLTPEVLAKTEKDLAAVK
jgi:curli biogenesis system outer membrane secretion channel CsgG